MCVSVCVCVCVCVCVYNRILLAIKKNKILPVGDSMIDLEDIALSEMLDRERQILYAFTFI